MDPWLREEFIVASLFLASIDVPLKRLLASIRIFGYNPRRCLKAAVPFATLFGTSKHIITAIGDCKKLLEVILETHTGQLILQAFEIYPDLPTRLLDICLLRPISDWAFSNMIAELDRHGADTAYRLYRALEGTYAGALLAGRLFRN